MFMQVSKIERLNQPNCLDTRKEYQESIPHIYQNR